MNLRKITLHQLRLFRCLGTYLSFTRVSEELHLSQPAVSIQIKRLEEAIGQPLIEHIGKKIFLTQAGERLFDTTQEVLNRLNELNEDMDGMSEKIEGPLKVSAITTAKYFMPHLLGAFVRDFPEVIPRLNITNQSKVIHRLEENLDDLVIMGTVPENLELESSYFLDNPLVVVANPEHPLAGRKKIPLERIAQERFLSRESGSGTRKARKQLFSKHGLEAKTYMELGSSEAIKQAVIAGMGISVLSMHSLKFELDAGLLITLNVEHFPIIRQWNAVHLKGKKLSKTSQRFLDYLLEDGADIWEQFKHKKINTAKSPR